MAELTKQLSVSLENKPGRMAHVCTALSNERINITAVTVAEHRDRSVLRLVTNDMTRTREVLKGLGVPVEEQDVVLVEMRNQPGSLAQVCRQLAEAHINIDYAYCGAASKNGKTFGIFRVSNPGKCLKVLEESQATRAKRRGHGGKGWITAGKATRRAPVSE